MLRAFRNSLCCGRVNLIFELFHLGWEEIAAGIMYDNWTVLLIKDVAAGLGFDGGRIFRKFVRDILDDNEIGIFEFTPKMFLFKDDWAPEKVFGPPTDEEPEEEQEQLRDGPDLFDEDLDSWRESATVRGLHDRSRGAPRHQSLPDASVQLDSASSIQRWAGAGSGRGKT